MLTGSTALAVEIAALKAEKAQLRAMVQELIDALMGDLSDADDIAYRAKKLLETEST